MPDLGGALARELGGARTICWALVLSLPLTLPVALGSALMHPPRAGGPAWAAFGYLTVVSMFLGFFGVLKITLESWARLARVFGWRSVKERSAEAR